MSSVAEEINKAFTEKVSDSNGRQSLQDSYIAESTCYMYM